MTAHVEVDAGPVTRSRVAVADEPVRVGEQGEKVVDLGGEAVLGAAAGAVEPPDLSWRSFLGQGVQHGEHRRGAHAGTDQDHGPIAWPEHEGASWSRDLEGVTHPERRCADSRWPHRAPLA